MRSEVKLSNRETSLEIVGTQYLVQAHFNEFASWQHIINPHLRGNRIFIHCLLVPTYNMCFTVNKSSITSMSYNLIPCQYHVDLTAVRALCFSESIEHCFMLWGIFHISHFPSLLFIVCLVHFLSTAVSV